MNTAMVIARNTISEALRKKILNAFLMVGVVLIALTFIFQQFAPRQELTLVKGMGLGIISLAGLFITVILCINLVPTEVERRTIYTILAKPVRRYEFLLGKFFGALGTLGINIGLMGLAFVVAVAVKQIGAENAVSPLILFKGILMIAMQMLLLAALAMFFSTFVTPLVNFFLTMVLFVIGNLSSYTLDLAKNSQVAIVKYVLLGVHYVVPNFGNFQYTNPLLQPDVVVKNETLFLTQNCAYAIAYATALMVLAILVFDRREV